jgi:hypothetical protein
VFSCKAVAFGFEAVFKPPSAGRQGRDVHNGAYASAWRDTTEARIAPKFADA